MLMVILIGWTSIAMPSLMTMIATAGMQGVRHWRCVRPSKGSRNTIEPRVLIPRRRQQAASGAPSRPARASELESHGCDARRGAGGGGLTFVISALNVTCLYPPARVTATRSSPAALALLSLTSCSFPMTTTTKGAARITRGGRTPRMTMMPTSTAMTLTANGDDPLSRSHPSISRTTSIAWADCTDVLVCIEIMHHRLPLTPSNLHTVWPPCHFWKTSKVQYMANLDNGLA